MKHLLTVTLSLLCVVAFAQDPIKVEERRESFLTGMKNALVVNIPIGDQKLVEEVLTDELKNWKGKFSSKKEYVIEQATKTGILDDKPVDVYVKLIEIAGGKIELAFAVDLGGAYLNKEQHLDLYRKAEIKVYDISKRISTEAVNREVKQEEDKQKTMEKELDDLKKDKSKLEKSIESYKESIAKDEGDLSLNAAAQTAKKAEIDELYKAEPVDGDALKSLNKEQEKNMKDREKLDKSISDAKDGIKQAEKDIELNLKSQDEKSKEIDDQKVYIEKTVKAKYAMIK